MASIPDDIIQKASLENPWFTLENIAKAASAWSENLNCENLKKWYLLEADYVQNIKALNGEIGIICAGNLPFVGLHDVVCAASLGLKAQVKLSTEDKTLMAWAIRQLNDIAGEVLYREVEKLENPAAVIATGSNNSARYFEYYFSKFPNIIRKSRNSAAILTGKESTAELQALGCDIFDYFGLGCRSVTHLYVPEGYDFTPFFRAIESFSDLIHHHRYANNYTYHKALLLMNGDKFLDNNFLIVRENEAIYSPLSMLHFSHYTNLPSLADTLNRNAEQIQCMATDLDIEIQVQRVPFGQTQRPELWDYADGVNTIKFLSMLS